MARSPTRHGSNNVIHKRGLVCPTRHATSFIRLIPDLHPCGERSMEAKLFLIHCSLCRRTTVCSPPSLDANSFPTLPQIVPTA